MQPNRYKDHKSIVKALRSAHEAGTLTEIQDRIFSPTRPEEELYDLKKDPHEINNLANNPAHQKQLIRYRERLNKWIVDTGDKGPESEAMYDSDMAEYLKSRNVDTEQGRILQRNIATMKQWAAEGK